jgi:cold shock CspA family protein
MYYATTGKWNEERPVVERIEEDKKLLEATKLFSQIAFTALDAEGIKSIYRELKRKVVREIVFDKHTILPKIQNIQEAYIGLLPAKEYLKLICDNEGKLQRSLFYDNVRDFQGNNPVNMEILATLGDSDQRDKFVVLNNGVTVVAQAINKIGSTFRLKDFQIVNGCQTSHVLFRNQNALDIVFVPVKIVVTDDSDVINLIIKGTNRQTEVKIEAFESLNPFQKELEEFYATFGKAREPRLYYERRSKQYEGLPIKQQQIISLTAQAKSFLAMFLNDPHSTHRYYGELLRANRSRLFISSHSPIPYYVSALALYNFDRLVEAGKLSTFHRRLKYQVLMLFRLLKQTSPLPFLDSKKGMDAYCQKLLEVLSSQEEALRCFLSCGKLLEEALKAGRYEIREAVRLRAFTADLISSVRSRATTEPASVSRERGIVKWFSDLKGYGFILREKDKTDLFVHYTGINVSGYRYLNQGEHVEFSLVDGKRGPQAVDVQLIAHSS